MAALSSLVLGQAEVAQQELSTRPLQLLEVEESKRAPLPPSWHPLLVARLPERLLEAPMRVPMSAW